MNGVGQNMETDEEHDEGCADKIFSWFRQNFSEMVRETGKL